MHFIRAACAALLLGLLLLPCSSNASPFRELLAKSQQDDSSQEDLASNEDNLEDPQSLTLKDENTTPVTEDAAAQETTTDSPTSTTQDDRGDIPEVIVNLAPGSKPPNVEQIRRKKSPYCVQVQSSPHGPPQTICDHHSSALPQDTASLTHHDSDPLHHLAQAAITSAALGAAAHTFYQHPENQHVSMPMVQSYATQPAPQYHQPTYNPPQVYSHPQVFSSPQVYAPQVSTISSSQAQSPQVYNSVPVQNHPSVFSTPVYQTQAQSYSAPSYKPSAPSYDASSTSASSSQQPSSGSYRSDSNYGAAPVIQTVPSNYGSSASYNSQSTGGTTSYNSAPAYGNAPSYQSPNFVSNSASHSAPSSYSSTSQHLSASTGVNVPQHSATYGNQGASFSVQPQHASNFNQNPSAYNSQPAHFVQSMSYPSPPISLTSNYGYQPAPAPFFNNPSCPPPVYGHPGDMSGPQSFKLMPSFTAAGVTEKYRESESEKKDLKGDSDVTEKPSGRASDYSPSSMYHHPSNPQKSGYGSTGQQNYHFQVPTAYNSIGYGGSSQVSPASYGSPPYMSTSTSYTPASGNYVQVPSYNFAPVNYVTSSYGTGTAPVYGPTSYSSPPTYSAPSYISSAAYNAAPSYSSAPSYNNVAPSYAPSYNSVSQAKPVQSSHTPAPSYGASSTYVPSYNPTYNVAPVYGASSYSYAAPSYSVPVAPSYSLVGTHSTAPTYGAPQFYGPQPNYQTMAPGSNYGPNAYGQTNAMPLSISCQVQPIAGTQPQNYYRDSQTTQVQVQNEKISSKGGQRDDDDSNSDEDDDDTRKATSATTATSSDVSDVSSTPKPDILTSIKQAIDQANPLKDKPKTQPGAQMTQVGGGARPQGGTSSFAREDQWSHQPGGGWPGQPGPGWQMVHPTNVAPQGVRRFPAPPFPQFGPEFY